MAGKALGLVYTRAGYGSWSQLSAFCRSTSRCAVLGWESDARWLSRLRVQIGLGSIMMYMYIAGYKRSPLHPRLLMYPNPTRHPAPHVAQKSETIGMSRSRGSSRQRQRGDSGDRKQRSIRIEKKNKDTRARRLSDRTKEKGPDQAYHRIPKRHYPFQIDLKHRDCFDPFLFDLFCTAPSCLRWMMRAEELEIL